MTDAQKNEPILLDQEGYNKFMKEIEDIKEQLEKVDMERGTACSDAVGDSWHDNFAYDEAVRKENKLVAALKEKYEQLERIKIVEKAGDPDVIEIGDVVTLDMISASGATKEHIVKLVASFSLEMNGNVREISLVSPIGNAIYHKHVGDKAGYSINGKPFTIIIKSKNTIDEKGNGPVKTK